MNEPTSKEVDTMEKILGIFFILLGILGMIFPVLPGFIFLFIGISLISPTLAVKIKNLKRRYRCHRNPKKLCSESWSLTKQTMYRLKSNLKNKVRFRVKTYEK
jgi:hypothetical protein